MYQSTILDWPGNTFQHKLPYFLKIRQLLLMHWNQEEVHTIKMNLFHWQSNIGDEWQQNNLSLSMVNWKVKITVKPMEITWVSTIDTDQYCSDSILLCFSIHTLFQLQLEEHSCRQEDEGQRNIISYMYLLFFLRVRKGWRKYICPKHKLHLFTSIFFTLCLSRSIGPTGVWCSVCITVLLHVQNLSEFLRVRCNSSQ